ncbi:hypothetical protein Mal4_18390 [Maioricimonas rarisocia]|uniref:SLA1 homology domain-containing protein n=1 Tax=Maioricimonas rarisocia TaxID=2528026 RepID=A0A517Z4Y2_9PLAN|nr:hypothetical protein [Maioricimonas rarisocia]QDU37525.1 hypothetical protein Mal4_18390 [Maioricimonas rarisocia]
MAFAFPSGMDAFSSRLFLLAWLTALLTVPADIAQADDRATAPEVIVLLVEGRTVRGCVDDRTNDETLWLRRMQPGIILRSGHDWDEVESIELAGQLYSVAEFRQDADEHASGLSREFMRRFWLEPQETVPVEVAPHPFPDGVAIPPPPPPAVPRVASLSISARLANWDRDPEADGLIVTVVPRDAYGRLVPVTGQLRATLVGQEVHYGPFDDVRKRDLWPELGRWQRTVRTEDFTPYGAEYKLEFRGRHPQFDFRVAADGLLTATLGVPGQGTFQASDAYVVLRPSSPFRDTLQQRTGQRFVRQERTQERSGRWHLGR